MAKINRPDAINVLKEMITDENKDAINLAIADMKSNLCCMECINFIERLGYRPKNQIPIGFCLKKRTKNDFEVSRYGNVKACKKFKGKCYGKQT